MKRIFGIVLLALTATAQNYQLQERTFYSSPIVKSRMQAQRENFPKV